MDWRKSGRSGNGGTGGGDCVEVARLDGRYLVRDSKDPDGAVLSLTAEGWRALTWAFKERGAG
ncbi:DUF397 domain-containing protein [Actinomadura algeriensis]|uniref:DUF397 domain-containing protein n=1 Tax=Actinomadura algeriensis TaxID=1679523 RepID=A0ABR9JPK3_9ACTN|nr:DUF397 domain-containing protein [Actinomadura algeriensis]MBE1532495.1 hypothetical protein [Actinomadura algeriensis]